MTIVERSARCHYLHRRTKEVAKYNPEQAEAFAERLQQHWELLLDQIEEEEERYGERLEK